MHSLLKAACRHMTARVHTCARSAFCTYSSSISTGVESEEDSAGVVDSTASENVSEAFTGEDLAGRLNLGKGSCGSKEDCDIRVIRVPNRAYRSDETH